MKCPNCGREVNDGELFCGYCGTKIEQPNVEEEPIDNNKSDHVCPQCGAPIVEGNAFCEYCGAKIEQPVIEEVKPEEVQEETKNVCPQCGAPIAEGNAFCENCGAKIEQPVIEETKPEEVQEETKNVCPQCGAPIVEGNAFCENCGAKIEQPVIEETKPEEIQEELKNVCPQCGAPLVEGNAFCENCGAKIGGAAESRQTRVQQNHTHKKNNTLIIIIIIIAAVVAVAIIIGAIFFLFMGKSDDSKTQNQYTETQKEELVLDSENVFVKVGKSKNIKCNHSDVEYESEDESIATVSSKGKVTGVAKGETEITLIYANETATCYVYVTDDSSETTTEETGDYVLPNSATQEVTNDDLAGKSAWEIRVARNEIYARHGRKFTDATLQQYFNEKSWYKGTVEPDSFNDSMLSAIEKKNAEFISAYEKTNNVQ